MHVLVLRISSYPDRHIIVAAIYRRAPPSNVNGLAAQSDGLMQSFNHRFRQSRDGIRVHLCIALSGTNRSGFVSAHPDERVNQIVNAPMMFLSHDESIAIAKVALRQG